MEIYTSSVSRSAPLRYERSHRSGPLERSEMKKAASKKRRRLQREGMKPTRCDYRATYPITLVEDLIPTPTLSRDPAKAKEFFEAKMAFTIGPVEFERMMKSNEVNGVDVRAAEDYAKGHIPGAINLPHDQWSTMKGLCKDKTNVLYCYSIVCHLAPTAAVVRRPGLSCYGVGWGMALVEGRRVRR